MPLMDVYAAVQLIVGSKLRSRDRRQAEDVLAGVRGSPCRTDRGKGDAFSIFEADVSPSASRCPCRLPGLVTVADDDVCESVAQWGREFGG
jgi:hypothetical protein